MWKISFDEVTDSERHTHSQCIVCMCACEREVAGGMQDKKHESKTRGKRMRGKYQNVCDPNTSGIRRGMEKKRGERIYFHRVIENATIRTNTLNVN